jgi:PAS domain S-box-containing protein
MPSHTLSLKVPVGLLLLVGTLVTTVVVTVLGVRGVLADRTAALRLADLQSRNLAQAMERNLSGLVQRIDHSLLTITGEVEGDLARGRRDLPRLDRLVKAQRALLPEIAAIRVSDPEGLVLLGGPEGGGAPSLADRPHFIRLRSDATSGLAITRPVLGTFSGRWVVVFLRRYELPGGGFGGAVAAPVFLDQFREALSGFDLGPAGVVDLLDATGASMVRPGQPPLAGQKGRILCSRSLSAAPMTVVVGLSEADCLGPWRTSLARTLAFIGAFLCGLYGMGWLLWRSLGARKANEVALLASNAQMTALLRAIPDLVFLNGADGAFLACHAFDPALLVMAPDQLLQRRLCEALPEPMAQRLAQAHGEALRQNAVQTLTYALDTQAGTRWFEARVAPCGVDQLLSIVRDITEGRRIEDAMRKHQEIYAKTFKASPAAISIATLADGRYLEVNDRFTQVFGLAREQVLGRTSIKSDSWVYPEHRDRFVAALTEQGSLDNFETQFRVAGGEVRDFLVSSEAVTIDGAPCSLNFLVDITQRKRTEVALQESLAGIQTALVEGQRLREAMDHVSAHIYMKDPQSRYVYANQPTLTLFGVTAEEVAGCDDDRFFPAATAARLREVDARVFRGEETVEEILVPDTGAGERLYLEVKTPIYSGPEKRDLWGLLGISTDITAVRQAERDRSLLQEQLQHAQKMESLGSLAGGVAHDMNNVLGAILNLSSAHQRLEPADSPAGEAFATITKAAVRGGQVVKSLLSFARRGPVEERAVDLNALLREEIQLLERTTLARLTLTLDLDPDLAPILGDASALAHAFLNLCVNAVDAMSGPGTLAIRTRMVTGAWVEVRVDDTGCGMPKAVLDRALDPFFTTKEVGKGTGLGLSLVYSTVKAHGGQVELQSDPGRGTQVRLLFPAYQGGQPAAGPAAAPPAEAQPRVLAVLLVDDDDLVARSTQMLLGILGHTTRIAPSGEAALALLEGGFVPDLVVLDMNMPGLGGAGTLPRLRALCPALPVLLATGRVDQAALDLVEAYPLVTLLPKPYGAEELQARLRAVLKGADGA